MKKITDYTDYDTQCLLFVAMFFVMMSMAQQGGMCKLAIYLKLTWSGEMGYHKNLRRVWGHAP